MTPEQIEAARTMPQERVDAARPFILAALRGGGSVDDCIRAALAAADAASPAATTIAALREENAKLSDQVYELQQGPWPTWAQDILDILHQRGIVTQFDDEVHLPDAVRDLLNGDDLEREPIAALRAALAAKSDALTIISKHDLVDFENPIEPGDAYRVLNNAILLARAALKEPPHAQ